jgi:hypothetical protein
MEWWEIILIVIGVILLYYLYSIFMYGYLGYTVLKKMSPPKSSKGKAIAGSSKKSKRI